MTMGWNTHYTRALIILCISIPISMGQAATCDYYRNLMIGQDYSISNNQYPGRYTEYTSCRWTFVSEPGTRIVIACEVVELPSSPSCTADRLAISETGNPNFIGSRNYCGRGSVSLVSQLNRLSVGLFAPNRTPGGRFFCSLAVIVDNLPPSQEATPSDVCDCGWQQTTRIVGGVETAVNEYPSMAGVVDLGNRQLLCGGSIISTRYVLTAGHCLWNRNSSEVGVLVGDHNIRTGTDTQYSRLYLVSAYEIHPNYSRNDQTYDMALIQTRTVIDFNLYVGPICLPFRFSSYDFSGQTVTLLGWGQKEFTGSTSDVLQKVDVNVITNNQCKQQNKGQPVMINQLCTFTVGKDACLGDSGGPALWMDTSKRRLHVVGVVSAGLGCASNLPGINSRVTSFISWIVSRTPDASYCIR